LGFLDDNCEIHAQLIHGKPVLGKLEDAVRFSEAYFVNGIGSEFNFYRKKAILEKTRIPIEQFESIIHPTASVSATANIGAGTVLLPNATVASDVIIGNHVIMLPHAVVSHDTSVGDYSCIAGGACINGNCSLADSVYIGANSAIRSNLTVGTESLVGMGAIVIHDVPPNTVVIGNPAAILRKVHGN